MKKVFLVVMIFISAFLLSACSTYDDSLIKERKDVIEEGYKEEVESLEAHIKKLEERLGILGGDVNKLEEEATILQREKERLQEEIDLLYDKRYIDFDKNKISYIYYHKSSGGTSYIIESNSSVLKVYFDTLDFVLCVDYDMGYTMRFNYFDININWKR